MELSVLFSLTTLLFFTPFQPVTMKFSEKIEYHVIGNEGDFQTYKSKNEKILLIKPKLKEFDAFLVVITKSKSYQFRVKNTPIKGNALFNVSEGSINKLYKLKFKSKKFKILEGRSSIKIVNLSKIPLSINFQSIKDKVFFYSKGATLIVNDKRIY